MKKFFSTPKRALISIICIIVFVLAVIAAVSMIVIKSSLISKSEAKAIALQDSGLKESDVSALHAELDFDDGRFQYEIDFYRDGTEYEYVIQARDGGIISRDIEGGRNNSSQNSPSDPSGVEYDNTPSSEQSIQSSTDANGQKQVSLDKAKAAALADAKLSEANVTFTKTKLDNDGGIKIYDIEFYTDDTKYDYEINASDGTVHEKDVEAVSISPTASADSKNNAKDEYIGIERAKEIALNHANLTETDVRFVKSELDYDDGKAEYEIEFYLDKKEYDYTIDAVSGNIINYDVDHN